MSVASRAGHARVKFCICATDLHHIKNVIKDQHTILHTLKLKALCTAKLLLYDKFRTYAMDYHNKLACFLKL